VKDMLWGEGGGRPVALYNRHLACLQGRA